MRALRMCEQLFLKLIYLTSFAPALSRLDDLAQRRFNPLSSANSREKKANNVNLSLK